MPSAIPKSFKRLLDSHTLLITAVAVLLIKLATFAADPTLLFFMGDSETYIGSAVYGRIPGSHSFG